jgi:CRISPR-associated protein Csb2
MPKIAERLYQLGRGVDMAWAWGEVLGAEEAEARLASHGGAVYRPSRAGGGTILPVPVQGSLDSLVRRHERTRARFQTRYEARPTRQDPNQRVEVGQLFAQPPKPRFRQVSYNSPPRRPLFDLLDSTGARSSRRLDRIVPLTELVRDKAAERLKDALKDQHDLIDRILVGRGATEADKAQRVRIVPLPSIGHPHADRAIRRVLVEIAPNCPLRADDLEWAFSGLALGEAECELAPAADHGMLPHYGLDGAQPAALWRTVTPAALPQEAARRRIDPARRRAQAKGGAERAREETAAAQAAAAAVAQALRHAGVTARGEAVRVQREPFEARGARAEAFAPDTRFAKERLWHVEVALDAPLQGPLVVGDGRYLGLGLMRPVPRTDGVIAFAIEDGLTAEADAATLTRALRRAVLARAQAELGEGKALPLYITGHEDDGAPAHRDGTHRHIAFACDRPRRRLLILAPHVLERRQPRRPDPQSWGVLERAMHGFTELRAGAAGKLRLAPTSLDAEATALLTPSRTWESLTRYRVVKHRKLADAAEALAADIAGECRRLRLPHPNVEILEARGVAGMGLVGRARLRFATAVPGPILLGRDRHLGGGLFAAHPSQGG